MAKLASYSFDLKHVPGTKNVVADALSREPFGQSCIGKRLITERYLSPLKDVSGIVDNSVQDAFKCASNHQVVQGVADIYINGTYGMKPKIFTYTH